MAKYKALFLDVDGTLVSGGNISAANRRAIFEALKAGVKITIASGRGNFMVVPMAHRLYLDAFGESYSIALNGSEIIKNRSFPLCTDYPDPDSPLPDKPMNPIPPEIKSFSLYKKYTMPKEISDKIIEIGNRHRIHFHVYSGDRVYFMVPENPRFMHFSKFDSKCRCMVPEKDIEKRMEYYRNQPFKNDTALLSEKVYDEYITPDNAQKIIFISSDAALLDTCYKEASRFSDKILLEYSGPKSLEFTPIEAGKGTGLLTVSDALNIPAGETVAMGDGENDLSMLLSAGLSIVPSNALGTVKERAGVVLDRSCREDAVAYAINKYIL